MGSRTATPVTYPRTSSTRRRRLHSAVATAMAALVLSACSSDGGNDPDPEASYSKDQLLTALNSVEVDSQTLSAQTMEQADAGPRMDDLKQVLDQASIEPRHLEIDNASEGSLMDMTMTMGGQTNTMTQASAVVGNTFVVVSGEGASGEDESPSAEAPDIEAILQKSVTMMSEQ